MRHLHPPRYRQLLCLEEAWRNEWNSRRGDTRELVTKTIKENTSRKNTWTRSSPSPGTQESESSQIKRLDFSRPHFQLQSLGPRGSHQSYLDHLRLSFFLSFFLPLTSNRLSVSGRTRQGDIVCVKASTLTC